ncbi:MAG: hypothetical protein AAFX54_15490 [Pseudomonadota bacterium]
MLRGFLLGSTITILLAIVVIENNCTLIDAVAAHAKHAPNPIKKFISRKSSSCWGLSAFDIYNRELAAFQTFSTGDKYSRPLTKKYGDYYVQRLRFTYLPSFRPYWLFEAFRYQDDTADDIILLVKKYDPDLENVKILDSDESWIATERTIQTYSAFSVSPEEFQSAMREIKDRGVFDLATAVSDQESEAQPLCFDGISYFIEIKDTSGWALIDDGGCDEETFESNLQIIMPLLKLTMKHLPHVGDQMNAADAKLLGFSNSDETGGP